MKVTLRILMPHTLLNNCFPGEPGSAGPPSILFLQLFQNRTSGDKWHKFLTSRMPSCDPTNSAKALKEKSTDPNHKKSPTGLILSSSIIGLLRERVVLLPLCWFSIVRTPTLHHNMISNTAKHNSSYLSERFDCDLFAALTAGKRR